jgi:hypothetical protein
MRDLGDETHAAAHILQNKSTAWLARIVTQRRA